MEAYILIKYKKSGFKLQLIESCIINLLVIIPFLLDGYYISWYDYIPQEILEMEEKMPTETKKRISNSQLMKSICTFGCFLFLGIDLLKNLTSDENKYIPIISSTSYKSRDSRVPYVNFTFLNLTVTIIYCSWSYIYQSLI